MDDEQQRKLSGKRIALSQMLPLQVPLSLQICATEYCNLSCEFCLHGTEKMNEISFTTLPMNIITKLVDDLEQAECKIKQILISGIGEPLIHQDIAQIVKEVHRISDKVGIVTNGILLSKELTNKLLDAGLDILRVSVNGLSKEDYIKYTSTNIDADIIQSNVKYFYEQSILRRKQKNEKCFVYVKIMNYMVDSEIKKQNFLDKYEGICDLINIENLNNVSPDVVYEQIAQVDLNLSRRGTNKENVSVCPRPFYEAVISARGEVLACCHDFWLNPHASIMGYLDKESFIEIWNSEKFNSFRNRMLKYKAHGANLTCQKCAEWQPMVSSSDILDYSVEKLIKKYEVQNGL